MLFDPTERNVNPLPLQTGIRTVKKLVLTVAIHDKNVTMAKIARAGFTVRTGLALQFEERPGTETHRHDKIRIPTLSKQRLIIAVPSYPRIPSLVKVQVRSSWHISLRTPRQHQECDSPPTLRLAVASTALQCAAR